MSMQKESQLNILVLTFLYTGLSIEAIGPKFLDPSLTGMLRIVTMLISIIYFAIVILKKQRYQTLFPANKTSYLLLIIWLAFAISIGISDVLTMRLPTGGIGYSFIVPLIFFVLIPMALEQPLTTMMKALFYSSIFLIISSLIIEPTNAGNIAYMGITANYNNMGLIAFEAALSAIILIFVNNARKQLISFKTLIYLIGFVISAVVLMRTQSRTAFLGLAVGMFVALVLNIISKNITKNQLLLLFSGGLFVYVFYFHDYFVENILSKFIAKGTTDVLSGRGDIWLQVVEESTLLGHGGEYFSNHVGIAAHNVIIQILGEHGIIASLLLFLFILGTLLIALMYYIAQNNKKINFIPFAYLCGFFVIIMSESVIGVITKTPTMLFYSLSGFLIFDDKYKRYGVDVGNAENIHYSPNL